MTTTEYMQNLGTVFEEYLNQDSGNKCYSLQTASGPVWLKLLNLDSTPLKNLHELIAFYNACDSPMIPQNWQLIELVDNMLMQHDWVPGKVLRSPDEDRNDPGSTYRKFMGLPVQQRASVFEQILAFFVYLEDQEIIVEDFYDGCIIYDFDQDDVYLCDLDHIHNGPYELKREQQYGSSRFMAPEESRRGAVIDRRTNVYTMGATGFVLLNDNKRPFRDWPLSEKRHAILSRATAVNKADRYASVAELYQAWRDASVLHTVGDQP